MSVWVMPSVDVYKNFLKQSQAVACGRRRSQAVPPPSGYIKACGTSVREAFGGLAIH